MRLQERSVMNVSGERFLGIERMDATHPRMQAIRMVSPREGWGRPNDPATAREEVSEHLSVILTGNTSQETLGGTVPVYRHLIATLRETP